MRRFIEEDQGFAYDEAPPISRFLAEQKGVEFADGRVELGVDRVLFATGYLYTFPFLKSLTTAPALDGDGAGTDISNTSNTIGPLITTGARVHNLAKHLLHIAHPTLVFPGLPIKVIPFPFAEAQAAVFARLWSNRLELPPRNVLDAWEREPAEVAAEKHTSRGAELVDAETRARKAERGYHIFGTGEDGRYINEMNEWVTTGRWPGSSGPSAEGQIDGAPGGSKNETKTRPGGKQPPFWDERMLWQRTIFAQARVAFEKGGRRAKTLEELGFVFEDRDKAAAGASAAQVGTSKDGVQKKQDVPNGDTADAEAFAAP
ncbi:hypothetical protein Micbo1qcDRAFT_161272 [Microdochium bolleyi]|uniref:FAD/NAD(P)-binding domain-containing protein n=1 Tax=Microdochium bolleyi TaxID=196109 RepID=A0A136J803_9PEZI|nr:hypothetical protein Micbo1qcDRAFT_161272 [Microdochium bolleyi]